MKIFQSISGGQGRAVARKCQLAFTMFELAISLGVVAFSLVAIVGVLPSGIKVQKDNLEDTIINQDGMFWLETIRGGARGLDDLTNFVDSITISNSNRSLLVMTNDGSASGPLARGEQIVGRLTTPKYFFGREGDPIQNSVTARVRAINGSAITRDPSLREFAFAYQLTSEVIPFTYLPPEATLTNVSGLTGEEIEMRRSNALLTDQMRYNSWELRLTLQWPYFLESGKWKVGGNKKVFRTMVAGQLTNQNQLYFVQPNIFTQAIARK